MPKLVLTDKFCRSVEHPEAGQVIYFDAHKDAPPGFALRVTPGSKSWILNYYVEGRQRRMTLPVGFGEIPLWGPRRARVEAAKIKTAIHAGADPIAQRQAKRVAQQEANEAAEAKRENTLGALLGAYVADMRRAGKASARSVERCLGLHVEKAWPKLWGKPAADVTDDDLLMVVARLVDQSKLREAAKLRAYLRAAYASGMRARQNANALPALRALKVTHNPARDLTPIEGASEARDRALSVAELRAYWQRIQALPGVDGALLQIHLLTGAQRVEQLGRITQDDHDTDNQTVRLRDGKGRRRQPRLHVVPLLPEAQAALEALQGGARGPFLFTITSGKSGAVYATVQHRLHAVAEAMEAAGELERGMFTPGDLRRTVETRLAAEGVSPEIRAQLQSHGLGGVQAKHYDRHDYLQEKRAALETLHRVLTGQAAEVVPITRKQGALA
jgi:integrase